MLKEKSSGVGQRGDILERGDKPWLPPPLIALIELSGQQSAGPWHRTGRGEARGRMTGGEGFR